MKKVVSIAAALFCAALLTNADPADTKPEGASSSPDADAQASMPGMAPQPAPQAAPSVSPPAASVTPAPNPWTGAGNGWTGQTGGMGCCPMGAMGGMTGMTGMGMTGMPMSTQAQGLSMNMDQGADLQNLVQLLTLQDILESLLDLTATQERALAAPTDAERQSISRELVKIREQIQEILRENRTQISGR